MSREHDLKIWPSLFSAVASGEKTFEARINDRDFQVGDILVLAEWDPELEKYTGRVIRVRVTYMFNGWDNGMKIPNWPDNWCVMSIEEL